MMCSSGNKDLVAKYHRAQQVAKCVDDNGSDTGQVAECVGQQVLGQNERYYLSCVTRNQDDPTAAAVCALTKDLTPEQQIAVSCAIKTGGEPDLYAACAGGQLLERELDKCLQ
jgi:hypothetical protein